MIDSLLEVKFLFKKLASASVWCRQHKVNDQAQALIDSYLEALERLGVWKEYVEAVFVFGVDSETAYLSWGT